MPSHTPIRQAAAATTTTTTSSPAMKRGVRYVPSYLISSHLISPDSEVERSTSPLMSTTAKSYPTSSNCSMSLHQTPLSPLTVSIPLPAY